MVEPAAGLVELRRPCVKTNKSGIGLDAVCKESKIFTLSASKIYNAIATCLFKIKQTGEPLPVVKNIGWNRFGHAILQPVRLGVE